MISISDLQLYNESNTIDHIKSLAFNRTASSTGETEALKYIENELKENKIKSEIEHFNWTGPMRILMRTTYVLVFTYLILFRLFLLVISYFIIKNLFDVTRRISFVKKEESKNIFTTIPARKQTPDRPLVILTAHYDSISVNIPYRIQVIIFLAYRLLVLFYGLIILIFSVVFILDYLDIMALSNFNILLIVFTSITGVFFSIPILYLVFIEKPSTGSIDNASGVSILLELAKLFKKNPLKNMDVLIIWTGAEEWGLKGSVKFCANHFNTLKQDYDLDRSYYINIDMVGTYIGLLDKSGFIFKKKLNHNLNDIFEATARQLNIPMEKFNKNIKPKSDYKVFRRYARKGRKKLQVSCFHSDKDSKFIHSVRDTPDNCSLDNLNGCLNICSQALRSIDLRIE